jgi:hypothetical protein
MSEIKPFWTDGPSDFWARNLIGLVYPEFKALVERAAYEHDLAYWVGGTESERLEADTRFRDALCPDVYPKLAKLYYDGVRKFGRVPAWWRWGYGWPDGRDGSDVPRDVRLTLIENQRGKQV